MSNPIAAGLDNAEQATIRRAARHAIGEELERRDIGAETKAAAEPEEPPFKPEMAPVNPYAPTGWRKKQRTEFDVTLPSGQLCRVLRLEREDLFRLNLMRDRKSTRLNSSHSSISYAVFCLKKK